MFYNLGKLLLEFDSHGELVACAQAQHCAVTNFKESLDDFLLCQDLILAKHFLHLSDLRIVTLLHFLMDVFITLFLHRQQIADLELLIIITIHVLK